MTSADELARRAAEIGAPVGPDRAARMLAYLDRVLEINRELNLTAIRDREDAVARHLLDSLTLLPAWRSVAGTDAPRTFLDVGTGGGFPGAVLAAAWPASRGLLIDGTGKKVRAVADALAVAGITNAETLHARGHEVLRQRPGTRATIDLVTARAVGEVAEILRDVRGLSSPGGCILLMKGPDPPAEELAAGEREARRQRLTVRPPVRTEVPGLERRTILIYVLPRK